MLTNTQSQYGILAKSFHWVMFTLFLIMFPLGYIMTSLASSDFKFTLYDFHKATGLILITLIALRLIWRFINVQPGLPNTTPQWQRYAAKLNIILLYLLMCAMPLSGYLTSTLGGHDISFYGLFTLSPLAHNAAASDLFGNVHTYLSFLMLAAFALHLLAAVYHHTVLKDDVLRRMTVLRNN